MSRSVLVRQERLPVVSHPWIFRTQTIRTQAQDVSYPTPNHYQAKKEQKQCVNFVDQSNYLVREGW